MDVWISQETMQRAFGKDFQSDSAITMKISGKVSYRIPLSEAIALQQTLILGDLRAILDAPLRSVKPHTVTSYDDAPGGRGD